jgi:hypothetical protein
MQHSVLGTRWVYDGLRDPRHTIMVAAVAMTGQGEALGMAVYDGRWYIAPSNVRIQGGAWTQESSSFCRAVQPIEEERVERVWCVEGDPVARAFDYLVPPWRFDVRA